MNPTDTPRRTSYLVVLLAALLPAAAIFAGLYYFQVHKPARENKQLHQELQAKIVGLTTAPVLYRLAPQFADADNDGVADAPKDAAKLIDPPEITFSWIGQEDPEPLRDDFKSLTDALSKALGRPVTYLPEKGTEDQLRDVRDGKLHVTVFSTGAVPAAVNLAGFVPVGMLANESGMAKHQMVLIVPADSPIQRPADLAGHELALTEPSSNSGYKAPIVLLRNDHNLVPERDYVIRNTMHYETSVDGIAKGKLQAAAVASDFLARAAAQGVIKRGGYRTILTSAEFPSAAIGHAHHLKPELAAKIRETVLAFDFKGTTLEQRFASSGQTKFVPVNYKLDWSLVRLIDSSLGRPQQIK